MDAAFSFTSCAKAEQEGKLKCANKEEIFLNRRFVSKKDVTANLKKKRDQSKCHKKAEHVMVVLTRITPNISNMPSVHARDKAVNRKMLQRIIQNVLLLGRQGIALRGHDKSESNFIQLINLQKSDAPKVFEWLKRKANKYTRL